MSNKQGMPPHQSYDMGIWDFLTINPTQSREVWILRASWIARINEASLELAEYSLVNGIVLYFDQIPQLLGM